MFHVSASPTISMPESLISRFMLVNYSISNCFINVRASEYRNYFQELIPLASEPKSAIARVNAWTVGTFFVYIPEALALL